MAQTQAPPIDHVVLLPRFTALVGTTPLKLAPIWVRPYDTIIVAAWRGTGLGGSGGASVVLTIQQSPDLSIWTDVGTLTPTAGDDGEVADQFTLTMDWIRVVAMVAGTDPGVMCWAVADLVPRHP